MLFAALTLALSCRLDMLTVPSKASLDKDLEILVLRHQLRLLKRQLNSKPCCSRAEKVLLAVFVAKWKPLVKRHRHRLACSLVLFQPETVLKWHRALVRRKWAFHARRKRGRPCISPELEVLVVRLARENQRWGVDRIQGELLKLGFHIGATTIRAILRPHGVLPTPQRASGGSWRKLLKHYHEQILACDFFTVETALLQTVYVLFFIHLATRRVYVAGCTAHPTSVWVSQQARQLLWSLSDSETQTRFLIHDRDTKFSRAFDAVFRSEGIDILLTPFHAPNANAFAERWVRTVRQECLDQIIVLNQAHLRRVLNEFVLHYNTARPHQGLQQQLPVPIAQVQSGASVQRRDRLGGIFHEYFRAAA